MNDENLRTLLQSKLGLRKVRTSRSWVVATCPFASVRHGGGQDENPSFGIKIEDGRASKFNCQGCGSKGTSVLELLARLRALGISGPVPLSDVFWWVMGRSNGAKDSRDFAWGEADKREEYEAGPSPSRSSSIEYDGVAIAKLRAEGVELPTNPGRVAPLYAYEPPTPTQLPETDLDAVRALSQQAEAYLLGHKRRLKPESIKEWELGSRGNRVSIPIRDYQQRLVGISGRIIEGYNGGPKFLHSLGFRRDFFLYGESKVVRGRRGIVTEGFFNVIGLWQSGYQNAVAIMGSYPSGHQVQKMVMFFDQIIILGDGDKAGREMAVKVLEAARPFLPASIVDIPEGKDPQDLTDEEKIQLLGPPDRLFDNRIPF